MRKDELFYEMLRDYHSQGKSNNEIGVIFNCHGATISYHLKKINLKSAKEPPLEIINEFDARCKRCEIVQSINNFQIGRHGKKHEYRFAYCNECRRKQVWHNLHSSDEKFLKDAYNRTKRRAVKTGILFMVSFDYYMSIFKRQNGKCFYTDYMMIKKNGNGIMRNSISIDKIIPELGYVEGNIVFCTRYANTVKSDSTLYELKQFITPFYDRLLLQKEVYSLIFNPV